MTLVSPLDYTDFNKTFFAMPKCMSDFLESKRSAFP